MAKTLIIAEKPSVGSDIARVLGSRGRTKGYIDGEQYVITWAIGHLVTLCSPEELDEKYKVWSFDTLPIIPEDMKLKILPRTRAQYETIRYLSNREDIGDIICATDSGREGELIFRYIYTMTGCNKPVRRLWISSMTDDAIREGFDTLRPGVEYDNLYHSAKCRAEADWLVGMNASRGYTLQYDRLLSVGRVQSPTLALMVAREHAIREFVPEPYLELWASFGSYKGRYIDATREDANRHRIEPSRADWAKAFCEGLKGKPAEVERVERQRKSISPPSLYDLTQLQRDANRRLGWTAAKTLEIAQALYEKHKLITYPRTDSRYLSADLNKTLKSRLAKLRQEPWEEFIDAAENSQRKLFGPVINDARVTDHHAIIPTGKNPSGPKLSEEESALFDLIARRYIAVFYPNQEVEYVEVYTKADGETFHSRGRTILEPGWSAIYDSLQAKKRRAADDEPPPLPDLFSSLSETFAADFTPAQGGSQDNIVPGYTTYEKEAFLPARDFGLKVRSAKLDEKKTTPPARYTEAMLLSAMEHAGRNIDDEELREQMRDSGLGTPATRAAIIERLIQVQYVLRRGRQLVPTEKGIAFVQVLPSALASAEMTGRWEQGLAQIGRGEMDSSAFMDDIRAFVVEIVEASRHKVPGVEFPEDPRKLRDEQDPPPEKVPLGKCPLCREGDILENRKAFYCTNWRRSGARCRLTIWKNGLEKEGAPLLTAEMIKTLYASDEPLSVEDGTFKKIDKAPFLAFEPKGAK